MAKNVVIIFASIDKNNACLYNNKLREEEKNKVCAIYFMGVFAVEFIKKNIVMCIAALAAVITAFIVPPDREYLEYFDFKTLTCLFVLWQQFVPLEI